MGNGTLTASGVDFRPGDFASLCDALDHAATGATGLNFYASDASLADSLTYAGLREAARAMARRLAGSFPHLSRIGLVAETSKEFLTAFMACQYAGLVPATLSLPAAFGGREAYEWQLSRMARTADLAAVLAPDELRDLLTGILVPLDIPVFAMTGADLPGPEAEPVPHEADGPAYIQFSSGSTSDPKGIVATQASVAANVGTIIQLGLRMNAQDRMASWLPLYHDMGLVGFFMVPLYAQVSIDYISPTAFARRPSSWLKIISDTRATITYSPSFGYELCTRRHRGGEFDLSCLRVAGIGGDMVRADALAGFAETFRPMGFDARAFVASYGMAEATLAISFAPLGTGARLDTIDLMHMQMTGQATPASESLNANAQVRSFVSCGKMPATIGLRILGRDNAVLGERQVGRIAIRGDSLAAGYFRAGEPLTPLRDAEGWFETGDLGYWLGDEIVLTGRSKDLILWNGRNIWPQDIEWIAQEVGGSNISRAASFDINDRDGKTQIMLLAECWSRDAEVRAKLSRDIAAATRNAFGAPVDVRLVPVRSLPMTSSGKLSRAAARARFLAGGYHDEGDVAAPRAAAVPSRGV